jgi:hypothetical protein
VLAATAGAHRFVWDLRYPQPRSIGYEYSIGAVFGQNTPTLPAGAWALPGQYRVVLKAGDKTWSQPLTLKADPRVTVPQAELQLALDYSRTAAKALDDAFVAHGEIHALQDALKALQPKLSGAMLASAQALQKNTEALTHSEGDVGIDIDAISEVIAGLAAGIESADAGPTPGQQAALAEYRGKLEQGLQRWTQLRAKDLPALNGQLTAAGLAAIVLPKPEQFADEPTEDGKDLP